MNKYEKSVIEKLYKLTQIPPLKWEFESQEYKFVITVLQEVNIITQNLNGINILNEQAKKYDDAETIHNIDEGIEMAKQQIDNSLSRLEELYNQHQEYIRRLG